MEADAEPHTVPVHTPGLTRVIYAPAAAGVDRMFTSGNDFLVRLMPTSPDSPIDAEVIDDAQGPISWMDADAKHLVIGSHDGCVRVYSHKPASDDAAEGGHLETQAARPKDLEQILTRTSLPVRCIAIERAPRGGPDKARVAVCSDDLTVKVVALDDPTQVSLLTDHTRPVRAAAWSPRSSLLVTTSCDGTARIWDLSSPESACVGTIDNTIARLTVESELASLPLWHPSGKYFLLPSKTNDFSIVNCTGGTWAVTGKFTAPEGEQGTVPAGKGDITFMAFSPNGRYLAAATTDKRVTIWETTAGRRQPIGFKVADSNVTGISWHPSKDSLAWIDDEGTLYRWSGAVGEGNPNPYEQVAFGMGISASKATGRTAPAKDIAAAPPRVREPDEIDDLFFGTGVDDDDMDVDRNADVGKGLLAHEAGHDGNASDDEDEDALDRDDDGDMDDFLVDDDDGGAAADAVGLAASAYARELAQERQQSRTKASRGAISGNVSGVSGISTKTQLPFQPTSTPTRDSRRYLAFNMLGSLMTIDQGTHQTVQFESHDTSARRNFRMVDYHYLSLGALAFHGALLAVPASAAAAESAEDVQSGLSSITYKPFEQAWGGAGGEWTVALPEGESVELIALGGPAPHNARRDDMDEEEAANTRCAAAVVATSAGYLRFFSATGMQRYIWSYGKPVVSMAAGVRSALIVYRGAGVALDEWQNLNYDLIDLDSFQVRHTGSLPMVKGRALRWIGFNEWDVPAMYDSAGVLNVLDGAHKPASFIPRWTPVLETAHLNLTPGGDAGDGMDGSKGKGKINYWPVGLSSTHMMCLMLKGTALPDPNGARPLIQDVELKMPILNPEAPSAVLEEKWMRQTLLAGMTRDAVRSGMVAALSSLTSVAPPDPVKLEQDADKDLLQLIQLACKGDRHGRALDAARELHSARTLDAALSIAGFFHLPSLAERMGSLREEVERRAFEREGAGISELEREWELELELRRKWSTHGLGDVNLSRALGGGDGYDSQLLVPSTQDTLPGRRGPSVAAASKALTEGFAPRSALSKNGGRRSLGRSASVTFSPMVEEQAIPAADAHAGLGSWTDSSVGGGGGSYDFDGDDDLAEERSGAMSFNDRHDSYLDEQEMSPPPARGEKRKSYDDDMDEGIPPAKNLNKKNGSSNPFSASNNKSGRASNPFARTASTASANGRGPERQMHKSTSFFDRVDAAEGRGAGKGPAKKHKQQTLFDMTGGKKAKTPAAPVKASKKRAATDEADALDDGNESTSPRGKVAGKAAPSRRSAADDDNHDEDDDDFELPTPSFASGRMMSDAAAEEDVRSTLEAAQRKGDASQRLEETQYSTVETQARTESQGVDIEQFRMRPSAVAA